MVGKRIRSDIRSGNYNADGSSKMEYEETAPATPEEAQLEGWKSSNLKPAYEPICMAYKPISERTIAANVLKWGTGGINVDGVRIGTEKRFNGSAHSIFGAIT